MIVITGATGQLGSQIVERLLEQLAPSEIGVSVRDPAAAERLEARGVRVRRGDYTDPEALGYAFEGASQVLVVSGSATGEEGVAQHVAAIDAAYDAGARRVLYTSHQAAAADSLFAPARDHAATEAHLEQKGMPFTSLRNGFYTSSLVPLIGDSIEAGELIAPADGPVSRTAPADLAAAAAAILADEGRFDGPTPPLTAAEAVDFDDFAAALSKLSGRRVRYVAVDDEEWVGRLVAAGTPEHYARLFLGMFEASRAGEFDVTDPTLAELIGRDPEPMEATIRTALEARDSSS